MDFTNEEQKELIKKLEGRASFLIPKNIISLVELMDNNDRGLLFTGILNYGINMERIDLKHKPLVHGALNLFIEDFKREGKKYLAECDKRRDNANKRWNKEKGN